MKYPILLITPPSQLEPFCFIESVHSTTRTSLGKNIDNFMDYDLNYPIWQQLEMELRQQLRFRNEIQNK